MCLHKTTKSYDPPKRLKKPKIGYKLFYNYDNEINSICLHYKWEIGREHIADGQGFYLYPDKESLKIGQKDWKYDCIGTVEYNDILKRGKQFNANVVVARTVKILSLEEKK
jgi:hypothetical protein